LKRVFTILWLLAACGQAAYGQLGRIRGELRYEQHYQDFLYNNSLTTISIRNPVLNLRMNGSIVSPRIMTYNLFTSLNANFISTGNDFYSYSAAQYSWNRYNFLVSLLPYMPVKLSLGVRENSNLIRSDTDPQADRTETRQQEQRADLSVHQVSWLPTVSASFIRSRAFAVRGYPYDIVTQTFSVTANGSTDSTGTFDFSFAAVDFRDRLYNAYDKFMTVEFSGQRQIAEDQMLDATGDYEQYTGYSNIGGSVMYSLRVSDRIRTRTSLSGGVAQDLYFQSRSVSLGQSGSIRLDDHLSMGLGVNGYLSNGMSAFRRDRYGNLGGYGSLQHARTISGTMISNAFSIGYSQQQYFQRYSSFYTNLSNNISRSFGQFAFSGNYDLAYQHVRNAVRYDLVENNLGLTLSGTLPHKIQSQSSARYRDNRYPGDPSPNRNQRSVYVTQRFYGSFSSVIPFNLGVSTTANWYFSTIKGKTYAWSFNFSSPAFFLKGLTSDYTYTRNYDPYLDREVAEHQGSFSYQLRLVMFALRYRYATFPVRVRELVFSASRSF
jgi:hypothetical protein